MLLNSGEKADLIIVKHVLEHFTSLDRELSIMRELLRDNGYIYVEVPGVIEWIKNNNFLSTLQLAHNYYFNLNLLTYVMNSNGFELIRGNEKIEALYIKRDNVKAKLPNEYKRIVEQLKSIEIKYQETANKRVFSPKRYISIIHRILNM